MNMNNDTDNRNIRELAQNAIDVQDAVNLSGVVHSFSRDISRLRTILQDFEGEKFSTTKLNQHPICILYSSKIASLTNSETGTAFSYAYNWCKDVSSAL